MDLSKLLAELREHRILVSDAISSLERLAGSRTNRLHFPRTVRETSGRPPGRPRGSKNKPKAAAISAVA
jgi:hypothetical protein